MGGGQRGLRARANLDPVAVVVSVGCVQADVGHADAPEQQPLVVQGRDVHRVQVLAVVARRARRIVDTAQRGDAGFERDVGLKLVAAIQLAACAGTMSGDAVDTVFIT